jgi:hypothetical protein
LANPTSGAETAEIASDATSTSSSVGKLSESDGLVRGPWHNFIDTEKCPLLKKGRAGNRKAA